MSRVQLRKASRWRRLRGSWTQARMWASFIIVSHPGPQGSTELSFVERDHEIQALSSYRSHQSFTVGIRLRCPDRRTQYSESEGAFHFRVQLRGKDGIAVVDEELIGMIARNGVPQLLERPLRRRMSCHIAMQDAAASDLQGPNTNRIRKRAVTATRKSQATMPRA
jgi:hypothetical protein